MIVGIKGTCLNIIKAIYDKCTDNILIGEKVNTFLLKLKIRQRCPLLPLTFNIVMEILATAIRQEKELRGIQIGRKIISLSLFSVDVIENLKVSRKTLSINKFSQVAGYKINIQKSVHFVCINNELSEREKNCLNYLRKNEV